MENPPPVAVPVPSEEAVPAPPPVVETTPAPAPPESELTRAAATLLEAGLKFTKDKNGKGPNDANFDSLQQLHRGRVAQ